MADPRLTDSLHTWNTIAESFNHTRHKTWDFCLAFIKSISPDTVCADLGCGNGRHLIPLACQVKNAIGYDISINLLSITANMLQKHEITNTSLVQGDLVHLPFKSNVFDHIIYIAALHNIKGKKNRIQSLKELYRVLKPEGNALVSVWSQDQSRFKDKLKHQQTGEAGDIIIYWRQHKLNIPRFYHLYQKNEFKQELVAADFSIQSLNDLHITSKKEVDNYYAIVEKTC
jgi:ubiquinone/menaquinone biosynthesis C-methylase UbiE